MVLAAIAAVIPPDGANNKDKYKTFRMITEPSSDHRSGLMAQADVGSAEQKQAPTDGAEVKTTTAIATSRPRR